MGQDPYRHRFAIHLAIVSAFSLRAPGSGEVMVGVDGALCLVGTRQCVEDSLGVGRIDAGVLLGVDHKGGAVDARQMRLGPCLRVPQAPHAEPAAQCGRGRDAVRRPVGLDRLTDITRIGWSLRRLQRGVDHSGVGPGSQHRERAIGEPRGTHAFEFTFGPVRDRIVAGNLGGAIPGEEIIAVGRSVLRVEEIQVGIGCDRVVFVDDRGVHPCGQYVRSTRVRRAGHITVGDG